MALVATIVDRRPREFGFDLIVLYEDTSIGYRKKTILHFSYTPPTSEQ